MPVEVPVLALTEDEIEPAITEHFETRRSLQTGPLPDQPGVYCWFSTVPPSTGGVLYIGSGKLLRDRVSKEKGWISGYDPKNDWQVTVVTMLKRYQATVAWLPTSTHEDAEKLESRLIEWHRACVGSAPLVVGWEAKTGSRRHRSEQWARELWERVPDDPMSSGVN